MIFLDGLSEWKNSEEITILSFLLDCSVCVVDDEVDSKRETYKERAIFRWMQILVLLGATPRRIFNGLGRN